jgi:serine-type D-Ala-D-Ala carboxypeptidase (penicillin-binding protein 5/6)
MKHKTFSFLCLVALWMMAALSVSAAVTTAGVFSDESLTAKAAFLMDAETGLILYERSPDLPLPPASTTKVMTALVAIEQRSPATLLRVSRNATSVPPCKISVRAGEEWRLYDLLRCILLNSANDASVVIAEGIAGSVEKFAQLMNAKARELGAVRSHFANPHGLDQSDHYATVRDMALIFKCAMENPLFREITEIKAGRIRGPRSRLVHLRNHNRLLGTYEGMIGGKTGYTRQAKKCFVGEATRSGKSLIVCVFGSQNHFKDAALLLDYGFKWNLEIVRSDKSAAEEGDSGPAPRSECVNGAYVIQVASFSDRGKALGLRRSLTESGYASFIEDVPLSRGGIRHRVKVGFYQDLESARKSKELIGKAFRLTPLILPQ